MRCKCQGRYVVKASTAEVLKLASDSAMPAGCLLTSQAFYADMYASAALSHRPAHAAIILNEVMRTFSLWDLAVACQPSSSLRLPSLIC